MGEGSHDKKAKKALAVQPWNKGSFKKKRKGNSKKEGREAREPVSGERFFVSHKANERAEGRK